MNAVRYDLRRHGDLLQGLGSGQPVIFSHGWPLSGDDWDTQMLFFPQRGYRVIAHDRRGHGRSTQTSDGHDTRLVSWGKSAPGSAAS
jgi:pimeloyl-ACP methyl ester carboxylesterase